MGQSNQALEQPPKISCPQCGSPLPSRSRICPECGVDLMLVALLAERTYLRGIPEATPLPAVAEDLVPRIGESLLEQGFINEEQLDQALAKQKRQALAGEHHLLGQTLVNMGFIDLIALDKVINRQILELHAAIQEANHTLERRVSERTAELKQALERVTELSQLKSNLISNVSHELRTPLAHLKGYIELIGDEELGKLNAPQQKGFDVMRRASNRLGRLIEDLIDFSAASREGLSITRKLVPAEWFLQEISTESTQKASARSLVFSIACDHDLPDIFVDANRICWVLNQLIDNAIKFTPAGGEIQLKIGLDDNKVLFSLSDTGIGIPPEQIDDIFEPFHQLDGSSTRQYGGTGLGLSLVKLILEKHESQIEVTSEVDHGSRFSFKLPTNEDHV